MSKRRLIAKIDCQLVGYTVRVYRDAEFNEYRVVGPSGRPDDYYCTDDKEDALNTAECLAASIAYTGDVKGEC